LQVNPLHPIGTIIVTGIDNPVRPFWQILRLQDPADEDDDLAAQLFPDDEPSKPGNPNDGSRMVETADRAIGIVDSPGGTPGTTAIKQRFIVAIKPNVYLRYLPNGSTQWIAADNWPELE